MSGRGINPFWLVTVVLGATSATDGCGRPPVTLGA